MLQEPERLCLLSNPLVFSGICSSEKWLRGPALSATKGSGSQGERPRYTGTQAPETLSISPSPIGALLIHTSIGINRSRKRLFLSRAGATCFALTQ